jgi:hypothetical protein
MIFSLGFFIFKDVTIKKGEKGKEGKNYEYKYIKECC